VIFGGFSAPEGTETPRPVEATPLEPGVRTWLLGTGPARYTVLHVGDRRLLLLGQCAATDPANGVLARQIPRDASWRWAGAYTVVEEFQDRVVIHTDPAAAAPVFVTAYRDGWVWSTSARALAGLINAPIDVERLACAIFQPRIPALAEARTYFVGVNQLPPGCRITLPPSTHSPLVDSVWRPEPESKDATSRLRDALAGAVELRVKLNPNLSCDLSGGLDSTSIALLAADHLPDTHQLHAVTVHAEHQHDGADLHYARIASASRPKTIQHHLMPLRAGQFPYSSLAEIPATDEPAPSARTWVRLTSQLRWMHETLGTTSHLTGDGGDSVLRQPPIHVADLLRRGHRLRAVHEATGWARLRHTNPIPLLREAHRTAGMSRTRSLEILAEKIGHSTRDEHGHIAWFSTLARPNWAEPAARDHLVNAARRAADQKDTLQGLDAATRTLIDDLRDTARTAAVENALAAACDIEMHNPFLDPRVVHTALTIPLDQRPPIHTYKPILREAMRDLLPPEISKRSTKGRFDSAYYAGMRANLPSLLELADGHLAGFRLIHPDRFRQQLRLAAAGIPMPLTSIEQALSIEAWLRAHNREPLTTWTNAPEGSEHV
jgi:asparagine synthase (glutamine-hydrolysing)